jgi:gliding motility-associated-like protein
VAVYRSAKADFTINRIGHFTGGVCKVSLTNNSDADKKYFDHQWNFGANASANPVAKGGLEIQYFSAGKKDISLEVVNRNALESGKYCGSTLQKHLTIDLPSLEAAFKISSHAFCLPGVLQVENESTGADSFLWRLYKDAALVTTSNLLSPGFSIAEPGVYDLYLTASFSATGQTSSAEVKIIEVYAPPLAIFELRSDRVYIPDTELHITNKSTGASQYDWYMGDGKHTMEFEPRHVFEIEGTYAVTLVAGYDHGRKDQDGDGVADDNLICYDTTHQNVVAVPGGIVEIPNAFTPSPEGASGGVAANGTFNDVFLPQMEGVVEFNMQIFDRWGTLVYESNDKNIGWDGYDRNGRFMIAGVYVYKLVLKLSDGERTTKVGDVTLIR